MYSFNRTRKSQRGAAALEFALVMPVLVVVLFGVVDFGLMINSQAVFANAARDAARAGSFFATKAEIQAVVTSEAAYLPTVSGINTAVSCRKAGSPGANCTSSYDTERESGGTVIVTITYTHNWLTPALLGLPNTSVITKQSEMRIE